MDRVSTDKSPAEHTPNTQQGLLAGWRRHRWWWSLAIAATLFGVALLITIQVLIHRANPILRQRVIETIATNFDSQVELGEFQVTVFKGLGVEGGKLTVYPNALDKQDPFIQVDHFSFHTSVLALLRRPMHVSDVTVDGLAIHLPPKAQRKNIPKLKTGNGGNANPSIIVDRIHCTSTSLQMGTDKPGKVPLNFNISNLLLQTVGKGKPMKFDATLVNPKPIGDIHSTGSFGPWVVGSPGDSPVSGDYEFSNADLGTLNGIGGVLSSKGNYTGKLNHIDVHGHTETPDFTVSTGGTPVPLNTNFHAIVDGTSGDTYLDPVDAMLRNSHIIAKGKVVNVPEKHGKHIVLDVVLDQAEIEDLLLLAAKTTPPVMKGKVQMHTAFDLPPGPQPVMEKLGLKGRFFLNNAHFSNPKIQSKVDELSLRGQGKSKQAKLDDHRINSASYMYGNFTLGNARLTLSDLRYNVSGAAIQLHGVYSLDGNEFDFHGLARLDATVSNFVGGWKGALLKPFDPIFRKNGVGTEVPIKISGTKSEPHFGLDFHHKETDEEKQQDKKR